MMKVSTDAVVAGLAAAKDFNVVVDMADVLQKKKRALAEYRSQMTRMVPDVRWLTLADVAGGEFLGCFFGEHEMFKRYEFVGNRTVGVGS
jgi:hypothetical protein